MLPSFDFFPLIYKLPRGDARKNAKQITDKIEELQRYAIRFSAAVSLFETSAEAADRTERQGTHTPLPYAEWMSMAGRDGAMTIFHFGKICGAINDALIRSEAIFRGANRAKLKQANALFDNAFPHYAAIRHAVGHEGQVMLTPKRIAEHGAKKVRAFGINSVELTSGRIFSIGNFHGCTYNVTWEGKVIGYDLNRTSEATLHKVALLFYEAVMAAVPADPG